MSPKNRMVFVWDSADSADLSGRWVVLIDVFDRFTFGRSYMIEGMT